MTNKMLKKLQSQVGESLAETLVAVLVIALALTMLAGMISATANMVNTSKKKMNEYYTASANLETQSLLDKSSSISIALQGDSNAVEEVTVNTYKNDVFSNHPVIAYSWAGQETD